jgi:hypothetical protein
MITCEQASFGLQLLIEMASGRTVVLVEVLRWKEATLGVDPHRRLCSFLVSTSIDPTPIRGISTLTWRNF